MTALQSAPIYDPVIEDNDGKARLSWILFFQQLVQGDVGTPWVPVATNLTAVGTPILTGIYYQNSGFTDFFIVINPNGGNTSSVAGTTYFDLPFTVALNAPASVTTGVSSAYDGAVDSTTKRVYTSTWTNIASILTVTGRVKN